MSTMLKDYAALCWLELLSFEGFVDVEGVELQLPLGIYLNFACLHALEPGEALCVVASALELFLILLGASSNSSVK